MSFEIIEEIPSAEVFNHLRELVGWGRIDSEVVKLGLANSVYSLCAVVDHEIVGFVRLVGDGHLKLSVEELIVAPTHQRQGIARALMERLMIYIGTQPSGCTINLMAAKGLAGFYASLGFSARQPEQPGMQMRH